MKETVKNEVINQHLFVLEESASSLTQGGQFGPHAENQGAYRRVAF